ncbi:hypothetical protein RCL1_006909 [Eukaryota sp. TZLM3-RCL]
MPSSKRARVVSLTKTEKKTKEQKNALISKIRDALSNFESLYAFRVENMRNMLIKELRRDWNDSIFLFGRNKVIQHALGATRESELAENVSQLARTLKGDCGLLFTNRPHDEVVAFFDNLEVPEYARSGHISTVEFIIPAGPLDQFSHTQEPFLRSLGVPTEMRNGVIYNRSEFVVASPGVQLTPEKANLLKQFGQMIASFKLNLYARWTAGEYSELKPSQ